MGPVRVLCVLRLIFLVQIALLFPKNCYSNHEDELFLATQVWDPYKLSDADGINLFVFCAVF